MRPTLRLSRPRTVTAAAAVLSAGLVLAACGDGDDAETDDTEVSDSEESPDADGTADDVMDDDMQDEQMSDETSDGEMADEETSEEDAGDAAGAAGSIADVDAVLGNAVELDYDPAALSVDTVSGGSLAAADVSGPLVAWFWAPWCTICRGEAPEVADVAADLDGEVTFVGVAGLGPVADMEQFVADTGVTGFEHAVDPDGQVWTDLGVFAQPSYVFVDAEGQARTFAGGLDGETLRAAAEALAG